MIPVCYYDDRMVAPKGSGYSPSPEKPRHVAAVLRESGLAELREPTPATRDELCAVHDAAYVSDVLACCRANGHGDRRRSVARSLPWTSGAMRSAALVATTDRPACALASGFHHAGYDSCHGFCTFNGLMVAAAALLAAGRRHVAILDCDWHVGDGTEDIRMKLMWLAAGTSHFNFGAWGIKTQVNYLRRLRRGGLIERWLMDEQCDVLLYQAGADPHVDDPLGGCLTTEGLMERDRLVFEMCRRLQLPVAWCLAGGYRTMKSVVECHVNTFRACTEVYS